MSEQSFENLKRSYWTKRAISSLSEMRRNKKTGLFPKSEGWRNVVEHELVEAEATDILAEKLGLSNLDRKKLRTAALLHDVFKKKEKERIVQKGQAGYVESIASQLEFLRQEGYSEDVVRLTEDVGSESLKDFSENFDSIPLIRKIMHYVDDITLNNEIVPLDVRIDALETNPRYKELNEQGRSVFGGKTYFEVQREISKRIEKEFAPKLGVENPSDIPAFIKKCIVVRINEAK